jgi:ssRNA-specific RNase YbeY (16S rRNA maturation enzyme)
LHLASHGLCHLFGNDHDADDEEAEMNARAASLRKEVARTGRVRLA